MKRVPSFDIGPYKIRVEYRKSVIHEGQEVLGLFNMLDNTIYIAESAGGVLISQEVQTQTFFHECIHLILHILNEHDLNQNEKFVDTFAYFVYNLYTQVVSKGGSYGNMGRVQRKVSSKLGGEAPKKKSKRSGR